MRFAQWATEFAANWKDLDWWYRRPRNFILQRTVGTYFDFVGTKGTDVIEEDWDILILLDACRYDMFEKLNNLDGRLEKRTSKGSATPEFLRENFGGRKLHDTIYVTANPQYQFHLDDVFHAVVDVWRDEWDKEYHTVRPKPMAKAVKQAVEEYPRKRIIAHFMQPHYPFIGKIGQTIENQSGVGASRRQVLDGNDSNTRENKVENHRINVWRQYRMGQIDERTLRRAYHENLEIVLPQIERLMQSIDGKFVVTSDHGNMIGEFAWPFPVKLYGHPPEIHAPQLVTVPWLVNDDSNRRSISQQEPSRPSKQVNDESVKERLEQLGYVE